MYNLKQIYATWTDDTSIFSVTTVILPELSVITLEDGQLLAVTLDIVQPDLVLPLSEESCFLGLKDRPALYLSTHHVSVGEAPLVIAHGPPAVGVVDLHSPGAASSPPQPNFVTS